MSAREKAIQDIKDWFEKVAIDAQAEDKTVARDMRSLNATQPFQDVNATSLETPTTTKKAILLPAEPHSLEETVYPPEQIPPPPPPGSSQKEQDEAAKRAHQEQMRELQKNKAELQLEELERRHADNKYFSALRAEKARLAEEDRQRRLEQQRQSEIEKGIRAGASFAENAAGIVKTNFFKGKSFLERVPIPGDIWVPLAVLLLFFLVMFPVNGHTRLMWLWLALTKNAVIGGVLGGNAVAQFATPITPLDTTALAASVNTQLQAFGGLGAAGAAGPPVPTPTPSSITPLAQNGHIKNNYGNLLQNTHGI